MTRTRRPRKPETNSRGEKAVLVDAATGQPLFWVGQGGFMLSYRSDKGAVAAGLITECFGGCSTEAQALRIATACVKKAQARQVTSSGSTSSGTGKKP